MITRLLLGVVLGFVLLVAAGIPAPAPAACPGCAILAQPWGGCNEAVQGGWVCP